MFFVYIYMLNIQNNVSRTNREDINVLLQLYNILHPQELHFLIELNQRWSVYNPNRIQNMTNILRQTFAFEHEQSNIDTIMKYLNSHCSVQFFSFISVDMALARLNQTFHLNPYQSICPVCSKTLNCESTEALSAQVYTLKGSIQKGEQKFARERYCIKTDFTFRNGIFCFM